MRKIPTLFVRDPDDRAHVLDEVNPGCEWVIAGEGVATRKYDGTCVRFDGSEWWARREVKPGKNPPDGFVMEEHDETTGKTVGWEPAERSGFWKFLKECLDVGMGAYRSVPQSTAMPPPVGTYELVGERVNGNPEGMPEGMGHCLVMHGYEAYDDRPTIERVGRDFASLRDFFTSDVWPGWEGIVWHHPDGRMAKLKRRDFPLSDHKERQQ